MSKSGELLKKTIIVLHHLRFLNSRLQVLLTPSYQESINIDPTYLRELLGEVGTDEVLN